MYTISCPDFQKKTRINHHTNIKQKNKSNKVIDKNSLNKDQKSNLYFINHTLAVTDLDKTKTNNTNSNEPVTSKLLIIVNPIVTLLWNPYLLMLVKATTIDDNKNKAHPKIQNHFSFFICHEITINQSQKPKKQRSFLVVITYRPLITFSTYPHQQPIFFYYLQTFIL